MILIAANSEHPIAAVRHGAADLGFIKSPAHLGITQPCRGNAARNVRAAPNMLPRNDSI